MRVSWRSPNATTQPGAAHRVNGDRLNKNADDAHVRPRGRALAALRVASGGARRRIGYDYAEWLDSLKVSLDSTGRDDGALHDQVVAVGAIVPVRAVVFVFMVIMGGVSTEEVAQLNGMQQAGNIHARRNSEVKRGKDGYKPDQVATP